MSGTHGIDHFLKRLFPPLIPVFGLALGYPLWMLGMLLGAQTFGAAVSQTPAGILSDRIDRRYLLPTGFALVGVSITAFGVIPTLESLDAHITIFSTATSTEFVLMLASMFIVGIGTGVVHPTGYPLISENIDNSRKGTVLGMWGSASRFGDGLAPAAVGAMLLAMAWHQILVLFGLFAVVYAGVLFISLLSYETRPPGITQRQDQDDATDLRNMDRRVFLYPFLAVSTYFLVQIMAFTAVVVFIPEFITSEYGYTLTIGTIELNAESTASFYFSVLLLTAGIWQLSVGRILDRYDNRKVLIGYLVASTAALVVFAMGSFSPLGLLGVLLLLGLTLFAINPARDSLVSEISPSKYEGRTFGYLWTATLLAASISPAAIGYIGDVAGLRIGFLLLAGITLFSTIPVTLLFSDRVYRPGLEP